MLWKRSGDHAVSEVVGNLLILVITVSLFSVVLSFVYSIPGPEATIQADIVPMLERTSAVDGTLHLQHTGGEALKEGETYILVSIDDTPTRFEISDGLPGAKTTMEPGDTWSMDFLGTISTEAKLDVKIVDVTSNSLLFYTVVQRGVSSGGDHDPIIAYAWADSTLPGVDVLPNNDYTTWRVYAVCKDIDGDLPPTGSVTASITSIDNGDGTFTVNNFGAGSTAMVDTRGDGVYMTGLLKVATTVLPGDYSFTVTATDDTGRTATATVKVTVSTSFSSIRLSGTDEAPTILKSGEANKLFLKLEFLANGESINVNGIRVRKLGTIPDNKVTLRAYWDKDRDGSLNTLVDYQLPGSGGAFIGGYRDFIGAPLFTAIEDEPTYVWILVSVAGGTEGFSVGVRIESQTSLTSIGVSTPIRILPIGSFPIDSSVLTIKGVFKVWGYNRHPTRILTGTNDVKMIELLYQATGETVFIHQMNLTLLGNIDVADVDCYIMDEWFNILDPGPLAFNAITRRLEINAPPGGWKIDKAWSDRQIYVYFNIRGNNGDTIGVQMDDTSDTYAVTEVSGDGINPQSPLGVPIPAPVIKTLASTGHVTIDMEGTTTLPTRAGTYAYQRRWLYRCYGEPVEFHSINMTLAGTIAWDEITGIRIRIQSAYPVALVYDQTITFDPTGHALFENGIPGVPMWTVPMDTNFYGYVRVDSYAYLDHGTEGKTIRTSIELAGQTELLGQITTMPIVPAPYGGGDIPSRSYTRTVNGQLYVHGQGLIPDPLVDSSQNVPVFKITFNAEGQLVALNSIRINKLGTVAGNLVTVRLYWDVNNDTYNKLGGDDIELDATDAGSFVLNQITFTPNPVRWVTPGIDFNVVVVFSLNLGTAGWTLGCSVSAGGVGSTTAAPNLVSAYPNLCLNLPRNPPYTVNSATVPIMTRGTLKVNMEDLSPPFPTVSTTYVWQKLSFWAEGENADVNSLFFSAFNSSGRPPADWTRIRIGLYYDRTNNSAWDLAPGPNQDVYIDDEWFDSFGTAEFIRSPLFEVKERVAFNILVIILPNAGADGNFTLAINSTSDIQSRGQVSGLSITPTAAFPLAAIERDIQP